MNTEVEIFITLANLMRQNLVPSITANVVCLFITTEKNLRHFQ